MSISVERMGMACNRNREVWKEKGAIPEDVDGKPQNCLLWWSWHLGLEDSKLIPHTFFDILFHTRCQNKSITGLEDIIMSFSAFSFHVGILENMFKKHFNNNGGCSANKIRNSRDLGDLRSSTSHDGSTSPFVACDASTEFWEPCLGTCNGPFPLIWDRGWLIEEQEWAVWPWLYISEISNIFKYV